MGAYLQCGETKFTIVIFVFVMYIDKYSIPCWICQFMVNRLSKS